MRLALQKKTTLSIHSLALKLPIKGKLKNDLKDIVKAPSNVDEISLRRRFPKSGHHNCNRRSLVLIFDGNS